MQEEIFIPCNTGRLFNQPLKKVGVRAGRTYRDDSSVQVSSIHLHPKRAFIIIIIFVNSHWIERQEGTRVVKTLQKKIRWVRKCLVLFFFFFYLCFNLPWLLQNAPSPPLSAPNEVIVDYKSDRDWISQKKQLTEVKRGFSSQQNLTENFMTGRTLNWSKNWRVAWSRIRERKGAWRSALLLSQHPSIRLFPVMKK